ncbi:hypothetical protein SS50377_23668 [Spironucleus salmonicida]|uniref:Uncharacterized protein n=1 Tax=Spironucleus salmonicida TaxID=348837 RepID=V6LY49_9EUKA|nr:hypothetical protein SS50377_23668 [Spironucleus salmonicida]|eukprot:EST48651.1 Hypothetical protein SS50377_11264 [Spironucleus salmonicida]
MFSLPFKLLSHKIDEETSQKVCFICKKLNFDVNQINFQQVCIFDGLVFIVQLFDDEYTTVDLKRQFLYNVAFYQMGSQKIIRSTCFRQPVQTKIYDDFYIVKYVLFCHLQLSSLTWLQKLKYNTICSEFSCKPVTFHMVNGELLIARITNQKKSTLQLEWTLTSEKALQKIRFVHENGTKLIQDIQVVESNSICQKIGISGDKIQFRALVNLIRQYYSHQMEKEDDIKKIVGFSDLVCAEIESVCPEFFRVLALIK